MDCPAFGPQPDSRGMDPDWFLKDQLRFEYDAQPGLSQKDRIPVAKLCPVSADLEVDAPWHVRMGGIGAVVAWHGRMGGPGAGAVKRARQETPPLHHHLFHPLSPRAARVTASGDSSAGPTRSHAHVCG